MLPSGWNRSRTARMAPSTATITRVRMKVARSELMFSTPTLAKIAVNAANAADSSAQTSQWLMTASGMSPHAFLSPLRPYWSTFTFSSVTRPLPIMPSRVLRNTSIHDLDDHRQVLRQAQDLRRVEPAGLTETHRAPEHGCAGEVHLARLEDDGLVERPMSSALALADEDAQ